jgi:hypothetical protein
MNQPTPHERQAMRQRYTTPKVPAKDRLYNVWQCGIVIYGPQPWGLCVYYINTHGLKNVKPKEVK